MRYPQSAILLLSLCLFPGGSLADDDNPVTVPVFLPYYSTKSWSLVRGSIITSDDLETTYTIFCAPQTPLSCNLALNFPFIFAEGNNTLRFEGTQTSTYTANLGCSLEGTTLAACSAYSSLKSGFTVGLYTGPTEISWSSTLSGSEVQWGALTLAEQPTQTKDASGGSDPLVTGDTIFEDPFEDTTSHETVDAQPVQTNPSSGGRLSAPILLAASLSALLMVGVSS